MTPIVVVITKIVLMSWLHTMPGVPEHSWKDGAGISHAGLAIHRPERAVDLIADVAMTTEQPKLLAAMLDVLGARESGYEPAAVGDHGVSCGAWQTPCATTPMPVGWREEFDAAYALQDLNARRSALRTAHEHRRAGITAAIRLGQAREAVKWLKVAMDRCPAHPVWMYASGRCAWSQTAEDREVLIQQELQVPFTETP